MGAFWALILDTWRQSKHQVTFLVLLVLMLPLVGFMIYVPTVKEKPDGTEYLAPRGQDDNKAQGYEREWRGIYSQWVRKEINKDKEIRELREQSERTMDLIAKINFEAESIHVKKERGEPYDEARLEELRRAYRNAQNTLDEQQAEYKALNDFVMGEQRRRTNEQTKHIPELQKGVEYYLHSIATFLFMVSMLGFIAICAGYYPSMVEAGAISLTLSKPIRRWQLFFGKFFGGLALYSVVLFVIYIVVFVAMGLISGIWHWPFFYALPLTLFSLALLYSIVGWVGLVTRSTTLAVIIGYVYYLVVDTAVGELANAGSSPFLADMEWVKQWSEFIKLTFPSFKWLRDSATSSIVQVPFFSWTPFITGGIWLIVCLGTAYNRFRKTDY